MRQRLISAAVLVPVVVVIFLAGPPWLTLGICLLAALAAYETAQLVRRAGVPASTWLAVIFAPLAVFVFAWSAEPSFELDSALVGPGVATLLLLTGMLALTRRDPADGFRFWIGTLFAAAYPAMLGFAAVFVGIGAQVADTSLFGFDIDTGRAWLLVLVATVWTLDTTAYVAGRYHGRGRFMNHISPNKTWSGAIGGTLGGLAVCTALVAALGMPVLGGILLGAVIAVSAQAGDLAESMLKRAAGAKDSGRLIPGHGGFLDRIDSFLFAAPAMYTALVLIAGLSATRWL